MFDSGVFREKNNSANAMIRWQLVRAFERGARRGHRTNTGLKTDACEVIFDTEDSMWVKIIAFRRERTDSIVHMLI